MQYRPSQLPLKQKMQAGSAPNRHPKTFLVCKMYMPLVRRMLREEQHTQEIHLSRCIW